MAFQPYHGFNDNSQSVTGQGQPAYYDQQAHFCAPPPDLFAQNPTQQEAPALPEQQALYDPFSHAEDLQHHPPAEADAAPPLPPDEAPPLPLEDAPPPLPVEPAQEQPSVPVPALLPDPQQPYAQQPYGAPKHDPTSLANANYVQQPTYLQGTAVLHQQLAAPGWPSYQYQGADPFAAQHVQWQQESYTHQYPLYTQPVQAPQQHSWQPQHQVPWQQPAQPVHSAPVQPQPQARQSPLNVPMADFAPVQEALRIVTDAATLFLRPGRATRPKRIAIVLRGLPGSGKSHMAKKLKAFEVEQGGEAPRIHAIDDYFVTEVEKEVAEEVPGKKPHKRTLRQMEYCFEAELEGAYKASLKQAFGRTVKEARFGMVVVDAPNLLADDLKAYWSHGQAGGYEVYVLEMTEPSPEECHRRNIHNRSLADIQAAVQQWQDTPAVYPVLDVSSLFGSKKKTKQGGIAEVEMEDESLSGGSEGEEEQSGSALKPPSSKWAEAAEDEPARKGRSKRPHALQGQGSSKRAKALADDGADDDYDGLTAGLDGFFGKKQGHRGMPDNANATRGVLKKGGSTGVGGGRSVRWADEDQPSQIGFRIGGSQQLETIYVLEGLGPPKEHIPAAKSFKDQMKAERTAERRAFRDILLGGRRA